MCWGQTNREYVQTFIRPVGQLFSLDHLLPIPNQLVYKRKEKKNFAGRREEKDSLELLPLCLFGEYAKNVCVVETVDRGRQLPMIGSIRRRSRDGADVDIRRRDK